MMHLFKQNLLFFLPILCTQHLAHAVTLKQLLQTPPQYINTPYPDGTTPLGRLCEHMNQGNAKVILTFLGRNDMIDQVIEGLIEPDGYSSDIPLYVLCNKLDEDGLATAILEFLGEKDIIYLVAKCLNEEGPDEETLLKIFVDSIDRGNAEIILTFLGKDPIIGQVAQGLTQKDDDTGITYLRLLCWRTKKTKQQVLRALQLKERYDGKLVSSKKLAKEKAKLDKQEATKRLKKEKEQADKQREAERLKKEKLEKQQKATTLKIRTFLFAILINNPLLFVAYHLLKLVKRS